MKMLADNHDVQVIFAVMVLAIYVVAMGIVLS
jgi:hypothetical protein